MYPGVYASLPYRTVVYMPPYRLWENGRDMRRIEASILPREERETSAQTPLCLPVYMKELNLCADTSLPPCVCNSYAQRGAYYRSTPVGRGLEAASNR